jgi:hypothetical protein
LRLQLVRQSPQIANKSKIKLPPKRDFFIDHQPNPLKQGISRNLEQGKNLEASVNFQALGQAKR